MTKKNLISLFNHSSMPESQNIEYKESWRDEYLKWVCGFANAQGGKIYIGIDDTGKVVGIDNYKRLLEDIPNKIISLLGLVADVNLLEKEGKNYIEIVVPTSTVPISYHGIYHYRSGSTKQELRGTALQEFLLKKVGKSWDDLLHDSATLSDINENTIQKFLTKAIDSKRITPESAKESVETLLTNLHLMDKGKLKFAALLLFSKDPQKFFVQSYFKIGRFGKSDSDLLHQDVIEGNIFEMADKVLEILKLKYLVFPIRYEGLQRIEELEYPEEALREAILNSIVHKDYTDTTIQLSVYNDKLMLWNPGKLPLDLSIDMLKEKHSSKPRNKNIADILFKAGYIEAWGRGISKIIDECLQKGLPEPLFEESNGGMMVTFFKNRFTLEYFQNLGLNERQIKAIQYLKENQKLTNSIYQKISETSERTALRDLENLVELKVLTKSGEKKSTFYTLRLADS
jgi:ATP-dependent DNA helicase RecG